MFGDMKYTYSLSFNEAKVFEFALNNTNVQRAALSPPLPALSPQEFFNILIQEQLATFTNSYRDLILNQIGIKLQEVFHPETGNSSTQKAILELLGLLDV